MIHHYTNNTFNVPTNKEIITSLCFHKVDLILVGGEAGKLYNLCDSKKDIDFVLYNSKTNMQKLHNYLSTVFRISYEELTNLSRIKLVTKEKPIEFFKNSWLVDFEDCNKRVKYFEYYGNNIKVIDIEDYVSYIIVYLKHIQDNIDTVTNKQKYLDKIVRYQKIIQTFKQRVIA